MEQETPKFRPNKWQEAVLLLLVLVPGIFYLVLREKLPAQIPTHWGADGKPNDYSSPIGALIMSVGVGLFVWVITMVAPILDPKRKTYQLGPDVYFKIRLAIFVFLSMVMSSSFLIGAGYQFSMAKLVIAGMMLLFAILGNFMANLPPSYSFGIRLPWTLNSESNWRKTHRLAAKIWTGGGIVGFILTFLVSEIYYPYIVFGFLGLMIGIPTMMSIYWFKKEEGASNE
jgi:uncharacterized membrane protein